MAGGAGLFLARRHAAPSTLAPAATRDRLAPSLICGVCEMAYLASRRKIVVPIVLALAAVLIALAVAASIRSYTHAGGDPGGRLMAKIAPVVRVVPGFEHGPIPWIAFPCDSCRFPATYAIKVEPRWDSCDGMTGTFGWDPVAINVGFRWAGSSHALVGLLSERLGARGWARGTPPSWSGDDTPIAWISPRGHTPAEELELSSLPGEKHQWLAFVEAKPQGPLVKGC